MSGAILGTSAQAAPAEPSEVTALWPSGPPGGIPAGLEQAMSDRAAPGAPADRAVTRIVRPTLSLFRPARPDGSAVLLIPGGSYERVVVDKEGFETARWLAERGVVAFVLLYRLPGDGWAAGPDAPLQDAQRALRLVRSRAADLGFDTARTGVLGFSAGGHLAARLATRFEAETYPGVDATDALSPRPDFAGLLYPVVSMREGVAHPRSRERLIGASPSEAAIAAYSADEGVGAGTPPTFLTLALDDESVPPENSFRMLAALRRAKIAAELHAFEAGGHGFGLRKAEGLPAAAWPDLLHRWGRRHGWFA